MESAEVIHFDHKKLYGFAREVTFAQGKINRVLIRPEIIFHSGRGYKMKKGKKKPEFNYEQKLEKSPAIGECLIFVRKKGENGSLRDKAIVWGLREQYKKIWKRIDRRNGQQKKKQKLE